MFTLLLFSDTKYINISFHLVVCKMYENLLQNIGLTENETKTYLALLKIGQSSSSQIVNAAQVSSGKIYETLEKLFSKGLVSISKINGVKHFQASKVESLIDFIDEQKTQLEKKEEEIKHILPQLESMQFKKMQPFQSETLKGIRSIKPLIEELFQKANKPILVMGLRGTKRKVYNNFWWHLIQKYINNKKEAKYLFSENTSTYYSKIKKSTSINIKFNTGISPSAIDIVDDHILIFNYEETELQCIHIHNKAIAQSFRTFFESLWKQAKE